MGSRGSGVVAVNQFDVKLPVLAASRPERPYPIQVLGIAGCRRLGGKLTRQLVRARAGGDNGPVGSFVRRSYARCRSNFMAFIIRSSAIHAAGCYTTAPLARGARLLEYTGPRISKQRGDQLYDGRPYTYLFGVGNGRRVIDGHGIAMFVNHCCDPNCETEEDDDGRVWIFALRDIAAGEELVWDYSLYDDESPAPCHCRSPQ